MPKQRLHLIEDALLRLISVILDGQERLRNTHGTNSIRLGQPPVTAAGKCTVPVYLREARLHVELLKHSVHVASGSAVLQPDEPRD